MSPTPLGFELSSSQARLWFLHQLDPESAVYNLPIGVRLRGPLDLAALQQAVDTVVARHEALRTSFVADGAKPLQRIRPFEPLPIERIDASGQTADAPEALREAACATARRPFDLARDRLLRVALAKLGPDDHVFIITVHHIVSDAWSLSILVRELVRAYAHHAAGSRAAGVSPEEPPLQYIDYAAWQLQQLQEGAFDDDVRYWSARLADASPVLALHYDRPRPPQPTFRGGRCSMSFGTERTSMLAALGRREGATLFMVLLAAFKTLLFRYTGTRDLTLGCPVANRQRPELEDIVGLFVNTLVLRTALDPEQGFREQVRRVRDGALEAYAHQQLPFEKVVEAVRPERRSSVNPVFQIAFQLQNIRIAPAGVSQLDLEPFAVDTGTAKFDLSLDLWETADGASGWFEFNADLFDAATIARMGGHLRTLVDAMLEDPDRPIAELPLLTVAERLQRGAWAHGPTQRDAASVPKLFAAQAARTPDGVAVSSGDEELTFAQLDMKAAALAARLRAAGVGAEDRVALCMNRATALAIGILGIWKAGAAYVPLDPAHPAERNAFILRDSSARAAVVDAAGEHALAGAELPFVHVGEEGDAPHEGEARLDGAMLAYVIYTSGTTGTPKGVMIEHRHLASTIGASSQEFGFNEADVTACVSAATFDIFLFELFTPLLSGGRVEIVPNALDLEALCDAKPSVIHAVPSLMKRIVAFAKVRPTHAIHQRLRMLFVGGDLVEPALLDAMGEVFPRASRHVLYGPTETTIICTRYEVPSEPARGNRIGRPLAGVTVRLCDASGHDVPIGVPGEIYIGGPRVARGYLGAPELTVSRYMERDGDRFYRTGDLARYDEQGILEFLGRNDDQVKIRGFRVEPAEIERVIAQHDGVREVVVLAVARSSDDRDKELCAYVVLAPETALAPDELRRFARTRLPEHMIPARIALLDALPLSPNGKVDRRKLAETQIERPQTAEGTAPRDELERRIAEVWSAVVGVPVSSIDENFFDAGGHSLSLLEAHARLSVEHASLKIVDLFQYPTIRDLASHLRDSNRAEGARSAIASAERARRQTQAFERYRRGRKPT